ncbi:Band 4.1-like protein 5 [Lamellibrachia satsuma]|nr:Band 4.1-like protein 5 [Lamellibrachia satsuma]
MRFFSRRRTGRGYRSDRTDGYDKRGRHLIVCKVILLDGSDVTVDLQKKSLGQELYEKVFYHLDLIETDYFGLQFTDVTNVTHWLDPTKTIRKQVASKYQGQLLQSPTSHA